MNIEHNTFTTLVFHVNRSMNRECSTFHKYFAEKIAEKSACRYEKVMSVIKCKLSILILHASLYVNEAVILLKNIHEVNV